MMISLVIFGSQTAFPAPEEIDRHAFDVIKFNVERRAREGTLEIISGLAPGADTCAAMWARERRIKLVMMPADWKTHGVRAGFIRNRQMAQRATCGLGFWHDESRGTANMTAHLVTLGRPLRLVEWRQPP